MTRQTFAGFWSEATATAHPPLYFLILRGVALVTTDFGWLRAVALLSGVAAVHVLVLVGREVGGRGVRAWLTGLLAGLLVAVSPRAVSLSQVIRPYMLLVLLLASALLFLLRYRRTRAGRHLAAYPAAMTLALTLHYSAALAMAAFVLVVAADALPAGSRTPAWRR
ncbi:MAG TPA: glycosyltransferase family 39 protein, partial [Longimicrobiales bacterium]|nr:glycosyltransferase family 39 protein [Longimicrobiales bacterium]